MDDADRAEYFAAAERQRAIDAITQRPTETPLRNDECQRICCDCEMIIPAKRLQALPHAVRCIGCQRDMEGWK